MMNVYDAIQSIKKIIDDAPENKISKQQAEEFILSIPDPIAAQLISAIYTGREHLHDKALNEEKVHTVSDIQHIEKETYSHIIYEKSQAIPVYLNAAVKCSNVSGFDLSTL